MSYDPLKLRKIVQRQEEFYNHIGVVIGRMGKGIFNRLIEKAETIHLYGILNMDETKTSIVEIKLTWVVKLLIILSVFRLLGVHEVAAQQPVETNTMINHPNKLSSSLKMQLMTEGAPKSAEKLNLLLRIEDPADITFRDQLNRMGAEIRTEAGDIITVTLPADQLSNLTDLNGVIYVEKSRPLSQED